MKNPNMQIGVLKKFFARWLQPEYSFEHTYRPGYQVFPGKINRYKKEKDFLDLKLLTNIKK